MGGPAHVTRGSPRPQSPGSAWCGDARRARVDRPGPRVGTTWTGWCPEGTGTRWWGPAVAGRDPPRWPGREGPHRPGTRAAPRTWVCALPRRPNTLIARRGGGGGRAQPLSPGAGTGAEVRRGPPGRTASARPLNLVVVGAPPPCVRRDRARPRPGHPPSPDLGTQALPGSRYRRLRTRPLLRPARRCRLRSPSPTPPCPGCPSSVPSVARTGPRAGHRPDRPPPIRYGRTRPGSAVARSRRPGARPPPRPPPPRRLPPPPR